MQKSLEKVDQHKLSSMLGSLDRILPLETCSTQWKIRSAQTNLELGQEHLGREIWDNTIIHGENHMEERNPHTQESTGRRDPGIPVARESPERSLKRRRRRRWRRFGERRLGVEEDAKRYLHPGPLLI
jgi:hypothetical protein